MRALANLIKPLEIFERLELCIRRPKKTTTVFDGLISPVKLKAINAPKRISIAKPESKVPISPERIRVPILTEFGICSLRIFALTKPRCDFNCLRKIVPKIWNITMTTTIFKRPNFQFKKVKKIMITREAVYSRIKRDLYYYLKITF